MSTGITEKHENIYSMTITDVAGIFKVSSNLIPVFHFPM